MCSSLWSTSSASIWSGVSLPSALSLKTILWPVASGLLADQVGGVQAVLVLAVAGLLAEVALGEQAQQLRVGALGVVVEEAVFERHGCVPGWWDLAGLYRLFGVPVPE